MPANYESGMTVGEPAWHRLDNNYRAGDYPLSWDDARERAGLTWEIATSPVYRKVQVDAGDYSIEGYREVEGWQAVTRDDNNDILSINPATYAVIGNAELGNILGYLFDVLTDQFGDDIKLETLNVLDGGRLIVGTMRLAERWQVPGDPSLTVPFFNFSARHDGRGGIQFGENAVRTVCGNTAAAGEMFWRQHGSVTIRHTSNWATRLNDARAAIRIARANHGELLKFYTAAADEPIGVNDVEDFLDKWAPFSTADTPRIRENRIATRDRFKAILDSRTCEGINDTAYGLLMAATELRDHWSNHRSLESEVKAVLLTTETRRKDFPSKRRAFELVEQML
jgi:phage/plasmid-like protein (TIGR03299 family)